MDRLIVAVHPGCSMPARTYPWEMFADAADLLIETTGSQVVLTGDSRECRPGRESDGADEAPSLIDGWEGVFRGFGSAAVDRQCGCHK